MIWIRFAGRTPTDADMPHWAPWTKKKWDGWLAKSARLVAKLTELENQGKRKERNKWIDANQRHWAVLKPWLQALSHDKCWFSEVKELYSHYDVEHYRPKKEAKGLAGELRDGYWWLAFDYANFRLAGGVGNTKKGGWFPLKGATCSTFGDRCEESETPYLIDPTDDSDVGLIAFNEEGNVVAKPDASAWEQQRVAETVKRLKLNEHLVLAEERRKLWQRVNRLIGAYYDAKAKAAAGNNPVAKERLRQVSGDIRQLTRSEAELSAVAAWCVVLQNDRDLSRLLIR